MFDSQVCVNVMHVSMYILLMLNMLNMRI